jgi:hypothetical protein
MADPRQQVREAVVAILGGAAIQAVAGRATDVVRQRSSSIDVEAPLPLVLYDLVAFDEATGDGRLLISAIAEGTVAAPNAEQLCHNLLRASIDALDYPAFAAQGQEVVPFTASRPSVETDPDVPGTINRAGQPLLQQADAVLGLRLVSDL